jgi:hypothetical protein
MLPKLDYVISPDYILVGNKKVKIFNLSDISTITEVSKLPFAKTVIELLSQFN